MSSEATAWAWKIGGISTSEKTVLLRLADHANADGIAWPGKDRIAKACCMHKRTCDRAIERLEQRKLVFVESRKTQGGRRSTNIYRLNLKARDLFAANDFEAPEIPKRAATDVAEQQAFFDAHIREPYPERAGDNPWQMAFDEFVAVISAGEDRTDIAAGVSRYRDYSDAEEITGTRHVMHAAKFLDRKEKRWQEAWTPSAVSNPSCGKGPGLPKNDNDLVAWAKLRGLSEPNPGETWREYRARLKRLMASQPAEEVS